MPNKGIHTIGMKFPIDVIFLNSKNNVVSLIPAMRPWRISRFRFNAYCVVELPERAIRKLQSEVGDQFEISLAETLEMDNLRDTPLSQIG